MSLLPLFVDWSPCGVVELTLTLKIVKMLQLYYIFLLAMTFYKQAVAAHLKSCGPYSFICEGMNKLRLCEGDFLFGPSFKCPPNTSCNEDSIDVCEKSVNYIDPDLRKGLRCYRNERIADPTVPDCKGYILCIPNNNQFQGIKFKCGGNTVFNGYTRTCSTPDKYKCPISNATKPVLQLYGNQNRRGDISTVHSNFDSSRDSKPLECKHYKFSVTNENSPVRAAYFCPSRPMRGESTVQCTVFSSKYCLTLERDNENQFNKRMVYRKPRM